MGESDVLGFYPNLTCQTAQEMVSGQPRGTYVIYKEDSRYKMEGISIVLLCIDKKSILCTCR